MSDTPRHAQEGEISPQEFHRIQQSSEFAKLKRTFRIFAFPMTLVFLGWYLFYVLGSIFAKDLMMAHVFGNVTLGLLLGIGQFVSTFLITWLYIRHMSRNVDPLANALREDLEGGPR